MENEISDLELAILKIIKRHQGIHHRILLEIILDKELMAEKTAKKNITNLIDNKMIFSYKYEKEIQYALSDLGLSQIELKKKDSTQHMNQKNHCCPDKELSQIELKEKVSTQHMNQKNHCCPDKELSQIELKEKVSTQHMNQKNHCCPDKELSQIELKEKVSAIIKKSINELEDIDREFDHADQVFKRNFPDFLLEKFGQISKTKFDCLKNTKINKKIDMSFANEIFNEIYDLTNDLTDDLSVKDKIWMEKRKHASETRDKLEKIQQKHAKLLEKRGSMGSSKSRDMLTLEIKQIDSDITESYKLLKIIRDELKKMNKDKAICN